MIEIKMMKLIYSYQHSDLSLSEIRPAGYKPASYSVIADQIDRKDGAEFIRQMQMKYVRGRKSGRLPTTDIVKLELELFMKLNNYRRKLV